ncbi:hypothetical protein QUB80_22400 [Chlorogloeopsis sp. ULAP01]|uniref:hypothetical protein n=1 Tax=Chlorogloeopsis sp. ULAP01 TaxID=3056483 RepID=UPI0025AAD1D8|nr:hypothetical protein [Chlorogloeopsis sp. ULAP01]MDM9383443.1 hypothetical protein [Chlorogloeopsis sp. ULAP01]
MTSTAGGNGDGGNITINTDILTAVENSSITANAFEGRGGNIRINTKGLFVSPNSTITASSQKGINGTVQINTTQSDPARPALITPTVAEPKLSQVCNASSKKGTTAEFALVGTGGSPRKSSEPDNVTFRWAENSTYSSIEQSQELKTESTQEIVEAQGWKYDADGNVILTTTPIQTTSSESLSKQPCRLPSKVSNKP